MRVEFGDEILECPICLDELDITDRSFKPCKCGYQMCRFCWNHINENLNGRCPACRQPYKTENYKFTPPNPEEIQRMQNEKKAKERERKHAEANARKQLANVRVVQRNLVYVTNLALSAGEDTLRRMDYFGRFGKIKKVVVNRNNVYQGQQGPSVSAYITYVNYKDASDAIKAMDGTMLEGRLLRASFGTTKYCSYFLRNVRCPNPECMYLHEQGNHVEILKGNQVDTFIKEEGTKGRPSVKEWNTTSHLYNTGTMEEEENDFQGTGAGRRRDLLRSQTGGRTNNQNVAWKNSSAPLHNVHPPGPVGSGSLNPEEWPDAIVTHDGQSQVRRCNLPPTQQQQLQLLQQNKERQEFFTEFETAQIKSALPATASWASKATVNVEEDDRDQKRNVQSNPAKPTISLSQSDRGKRTRYENGEAHPPHEMDPTKHKNQTNTKKNTELARQTQNKPQHNTNGNYKLSQKGQRKPTREELGEIPGGEEFGEEHIEEDNSKSSPKGAKGLRVSHQSRSPQETQSPTSLNESQFLPRDEGESPIEKNLSPKNGNEIGTDGKIMEDRKNGKIIEHVKNGKTMEDRKNGKTMEDRKNGKIIEDLKNEKTTEDKKNGKTTEDKKNGKNGNPPTEDKKNGKNGIPTEDKKNGKTITEDGKTSKEDGKNGNMMVYPETHQPNNGIKSEVTKESKDTETQYNKDGAKPEPPVTEAVTALFETVQGVESRLDSDLLHTPLEDIIYAKDLHPMAVNTIFSQNHCPGYAIGEWSHDTSSHIPPGFEHLHGNDFLQHVEPDFPSEFQGLEDWLRLKFNDLFLEGPTETITEISNPSWNNEFLFPCGNSVTASRFAFARDDGGFMRDEPKEGYQDPHQECFIFPSVHTHPPVAGTGGEGSYPVVLGSPSSMTQGEFGGGGLNGVEGWSSQSQGASSQGGVPPATQVLQTQLLQVQILQNHLMQTAHTPSMPSVSPPPQPHTELLTLLQPQPVPPGVPQPLLQSHFQSLHSLSQESLQAQGGQEQVQTQRQAQTQGQVQRQTQNQGQTHRQTQVQAYVQAQTQTQSLKAQGKQQQQQQEQQQQRQQQQQQRHQRLQQKQLVGPSQGYSNFGGCLDPMWGHAQVGPEVYRDIGIAQAYPNNLLMVMQPHPPLQVQPQLRHPQPIPPQWATNVQQQNMYWAHPPVMRGIPSGALHQPTPIQQVVPPPGL